MILALVLAEVGTYDGLDGYDIIYVGSIVGAIFGIAGIIWKIFNPFYRMVVKTLEWNEDFRRAWEGVPESSTNVKLPGVMERLDRLDGALNNQGQSLKDSVDKIANMVESMEKTIAKIERDQHDVVSKITTISNDIAEQHKIYNKNNKTIVDTLYKHYIELPELERYNEDGRV